MSVKFSNDTIKKLGKELPTVYMERVELFDDSFKIKLALYVDGNASEEDTFSEYKKNVLSKLNYYVTLIMDGPVSPSWSLENMPAPAVELISDKDYSGRSFTLLDTVTHYAGAILDATAGVSAADFGLEPSAGVGSSIIYTSATDGATYRPLARNYYAADEIGTPSTDRISKLLSGQKTIFDFIRRDGDYKIEGVPLAPSAEYFDLPYGAATAVSIKDIYRNDLGGITDENGDFPAPVVWGYGSAVQTFTWSDPNLTTDPIGYEYPYPPNGGAGGNTIKLTIDDFNSNYEKIYKPNGNLVYKFCATIEEAFGGTITYADGTWMNFSKWATAALAAAPRISMAAYSSLVDVDVAIDSGNTQYMCNGIVTAGDPLSLSKAGDPMAKLNDIATSDITYETITEYGKVVDKPIVVYVNTSGEEYEGTPIQGTDSLYYEEDEISLLQIRELFNNFLNTNRASTARDRTDPVANSGAEDIEDNLLFILNQYGEDPSLLTKLNQFRKSFPDTSSASTAGQLYQQLKKLIFDTNNAIRRAPVLMKKLARSAVVVDYRHEIFSTWQQPDHALPYEYTGIYEPPTNAEYVNPKLSKVSKFGDRYSPTAADWGYEALDQVNIFINGFYFFDYEKAIQRTSGLSKLLDINKIDNLFGRRMVQNKFKLLKNEISQHQLTDGKDSFYSYAPDATGEFFRVSDEVSDIGTPSTRYHTGDAIPTDFIADGETPIGTHPKGGSYAEYSPKDQAPIPMYSRFMSSVSGDENGYNEGYPRAYVDVMNDDLVRTEGENEVLGISAGRSYSYTALRNFEFLDNLKFDNKPYRLMAFEFQNVIPSQNLRADYDPTYQDYLTYEVVVTDDTTSIFLEFDRNYGKMKMNLIAYLWAAQEFCSYNNIDGLFNDFFARHQNNLYSVSPQNAPWIMAPLVYHLHLDLLTNEHNGDKLKILDEAIKISKKINPETGSLPELLAFKIKVDGLYEAYYDSSNSNSAAYEYSRMRNSARYNGPYNIKYGGNDGTTSPASTYYPLPPLQEMYYSTETSTSDATDSEGNYIAQDADQTMVKMSFGIMNMPSNLVAIDDGYGPMIPQIILSTRQKALDENAKTWKGERKHWMVEKYEKERSGEFSVPDTSMQYAGVDPDKFYQLAAYGQQATGGGAFAESARGNTIELKAVGYSIDANVEIPMDKVVVTTSATVLQDKNWVRNGTWDGGETSQNRASTTSPRYVQMYLYAGMTYSLTFRIAHQPLNWISGVYGDSSEYYDAFDGTAVSKALWQSETYTFTVPKSVKQGTAAKTLAYDGEIMDEGHTNFYLDATNLWTQGGVQDTTGAKIEVEFPQGSSITGYDLYGFTSNSAWVSEATVEEKSIHKGSTFPNLPLLYAFPGDRGAGYDSPENSWPSPPNFDDYADNNPQ